MNIRAIIWDFGGVILRTTNPESRNQLASEFGMTRLELEYLVFASPLGKKAQLGEITPDDLWAGLLSNLGAPIEESKTIQKRFWGGDCLDHNLIEYIQSLKSSYKTALLSNAWKDLRHLLNNEWEISKIFDEIIVSAEVKVMKPDPQIYQITLERLNIDAHEAIFIDDFERNIKGAQRVGMHAVQFLNPEQIKTDLDKILKTSN
ncbi:MAG: HAD family phosphatase [Anaerolineales bacterium]|nr:HAD family phosphatase [Anaerolineales bacterium]